MVRYVLVMDLTLTPYQCSHSQKDRLGLNFFPQRSLFNMCILKLYHVDTPGLDSVSM